MTPRVLRFLVATTMALALAGCLSEESDAQGNGYKRPPGSTQYLFIVKTYERSQATDEEREIGRRIHVKVNAIAKDEKNPRGWKRNGREGWYPYEADEPTPFEFEVAIGGPDDPRNVITGEVTATLADAGYGWKIVCTVKRDGVTIKTDSAQNLSESYVDLTVNCLF